MRLETAWRILRSTIQRRCAIGARRKEMCLGACDSQGAPRRAGDRNGKLRGLSRVKISQGDSVIT